MALQNFASKKKFRTNCFGPIDHILTPQNGLIEKFSYSQGNELQTPDSCTKLIDFRVYNREMELKRRELEKKEKQWEEELLRSMKSCDLETNKDQTPKITNPTQSLSSHNLKSSVKFKNMKKSTSYSYCICEEKRLPEEKCENKPSSNSCECTCEDANSKLSKTSENLDKKGSKIGNKEDFMPILKEMK